VAGADRLRVGADRFGCALGVDALAAHRRRVLLVNGNKWPTAAYGPFSDSSSAAARGGVPGNRLRFPGVPIRRDFCRLPPSPPRSMPVPRRASFASLAFVVVVDDGLIALITRMRGDRARNAPHVRHAPDHTYDTRELLAIANLEPECQA